MRKEMWELGIGAAWLFGVPLMLPLLRSFAHDYWILQRGYQQYIYGALLALVWYAGAWLFWPRFSQLHTPKLLALLLVFAGFIIYSGGYLVLCAINCIGDSSIVERVDVRLVERYKNGVQFATTSGALSGLEFECSASAWGPIGVGQHHLLLRPGRIGIPWGRLERS
jgi:hypothetical protein